MIGSAAIVNLLVDVIAHEIQDKGGLEAVPRLQARVLLGEALDAWRDQAPWPTRRESRFERARRDPVFHALVQLLHGVMLNGEGQYTPTEVREACMVAQTMLEETRTHPLLRLDARIGADQPVTEAEAQAQADAKFAKKLGMSIDELILSERVHKRLDWANIASIGDLVTKRDGELRAIRGFGSASLREVKRKLADWGLTLGMSVGTPAGVDLPAGEAGAAGTGDPPCPS